MIIQNQIRIETGFGFVSVTQLELRQEAGEHVWLKIRGVIEEDMIRRAVETGADSAVEVYLLEENQLLFSGVPVSLKIEHGENTEAVLEAASRSILMDIEKKNRSFQRKTMKYTKLFEEVIRGYDGDFMVREQKEDDIETPYIQYGETDWQFLKRLASGYGCTLYVHAGGDKPQVYIGMGDGGEEPEGQPSAWQMKKQVEEYLRFKKEADVMEQGFLQCGVTGTTRYRIGDKICCSGIEFHIAGMKAALTHGEIRYTYQLVKKDGIPVRKLRNPCLQGITCAGSVLEAGRNRVKIHLDMDKEQNEADAYWYPTVRTDWYCMPESGSRVFLRIPSDDEKEAYVTNQQRTDGESSGTTRNPDEKCMETKDGKELKFTADAVRIHGAGNRVRMELEERKGITVKSAEGIRLDAGNVFRCHGKTVTIKSGERVLLHTPRTAVVLDDIIQVKG